MFQFNNACPKPATAERYETSAVSAKVKKLQNTQKKKTQNMQRTRWEQKILITDKTRANNETGRLFVRGSKSIHIMYLCKSTDTV